MVIAGRRLINAAVVAVTLVVVLPAIAAAERIRRGAGRRVALRAMRAAARLRGVRFVIEGATALDPARRYVLVANHSSPIDIPAMLMAFPDVRFVAASELFRVPLLAGAMRALDTVPIDRRSSLAARKQLAALADSADWSCVAVFAEGKIAPAGRRLPFRTGAFVLAIETGATVLPVAIRGTDVVLPPGAKLAVRPGTIHVTVLDPIPTVGLRADDRELLRDRAEAAVLAALGAP